MSGPFYRSALWVHLALLLYLSLGVHGLTRSLEKSPTPRAALVSLAQDHDLSAVLSSVAQLEQSFNSRYQYEWVFFSPAPLSENFKVLTSNATNATCMYEVVETKTWDQADELVSTVADHEYHQAVLVKEISRWRSGPFATEGRLKNYDYFWSIEPGAQSPLKVGFDVFRFMRDHDIASGLRKHPINAGHLRLLSPCLHSFVSDNSDLLHADADLSWLDDTSPSNVFGDAHMYDTTTGPAMTLGDGCERFVLDTDKTVGSRPEEFSSWMSSGTAAMEVGSLAFLRGPGHQALLKHLDNSPEYQHSIPEVPVHAISASMFLSKRHIWSFTDTQGKDTTTTEPCGDSPAQKRTRQQRNMNKNTKKEEIFDAMRELYVLWEFLSRDFLNKVDGPKLRSGDTVIDERNFEMYRGSG